MTTDRYPTETFDDPETDNGTMPDNVAELAEHVVGRRIVSAERQSISWDDATWGDHWSSTGSGLVLTLDDGTQVALIDTGDCCAYTELKEFFLDPASVNHVILGVGTTEEYTTWHIYADYGDILRLQVGWSAGNPFYYGYGFDIAVRELPCPPQ